MMYEMYKGYYIHPDKVNQGEYEVTAKDFNDQHIKISSAKSIEECKKNIDNYILSKGGE